MSSTAAGIAGGVHLRPARLEDAAACGVIAYEAFKHIAEKHGFLPDFPHPDVSTGLLHMLFASPSFYGVVAEVDGVVVGSNCLDERGAIGGVGPITISPTLQNGGIGAALMQDVIARSKHSTPAGVRLVQAAYHSRSLALYTKLGFDTREPLSVMHGELKPRRIAGFDVRPATEADVAACDALCFATHGHTRTGDLRDGIASGAAAVVERRGKITGYTSGLGFFGHAVAETDEDMEALIASAASFVGPGILVPTRNARLFRWCLQQGLRVVFPATLMSMGLYQEPRGSWMPSILY